MNGGHPQGGFTIVETLVVLAVTGMLLASAVLLVSGQQNKVQFQQAIQDVQQNIQQVINEVGAGYYPSNNNVICSLSGGEVRLSNGSRPQGSNTDCIFLGKAIQFGVNTAAGDEYVVHSIAGLREGTAVASGSGSLAAADPTAIARGTDPDNSSPSYPNISQNEQLLYGLDVRDMYYLQGATRRDVGAVAFVSGLGKYEDSRLTTGSQQVDVIPVGGSGVTTASPLSTDTQRVVDNINNNLATAPPNPASGVRICFVSGGTNQSGLITIGSSSRGPSVTLSIKENRTCS